MSQRKRKGARFRQRFRDWGLRLIGYPVLAIALVLVALLTGWGIAGRHSTAIVESVIRQILPGNEVDIGKLSLSWPLQVRAENVRFGNRLAPIFEAEEIVLTALPEDLLQKKITSLRIVEPAIRLTSSGPTRPVAAPGPDHLKEPPFLELLRPWSLGEVVCQYGTVRTRDVGLDGLRLAGKFAFHLENVSLGRTQPLTVTFWEVAAGSRPGGFLRLDLVELDIVPAALLDLQIAGLRLKGGDLKVGEALLDIFPSGSPAGSDPGPSSFLLKELGIEGLRVSLDDRRKLASAVSFSLNTVLRDISPAAATSIIGEEIQTIEVNHIEILSPFDPLAKVLTLRTLRLDFTLAGLIRRELEQVTAIGPSIFVGPDLFWYMDEAQKQTDPNPSGSTAQPGWKVDRFVLQEGKLVLGSGGRASLGLPLSFHTTIDNVSLDDLTSLRGEGVLEVPAQEYVFDAYELEFVTKGGELRFSYPPEKNVNNLVGTLKIDSIRWRQFRATEGWVSVTFDRSGINGQAGAEAYSGYLSGGASFFFQPESPWIAWGSGKQVNLKSLTDILAPGNFSMTGQADFKLQVDARRTLIQRVKGSLAASSSGKLVIGKLNDLLERIPTDWPEIKSDSMEIALRTLRDFRYDSCTADLWLVDSQGKLALDLNGPEGSRKFNVFLHQADSDGAAWTEPETRRQTVGDPAASL